MILLTYVEAFLKDVAKETGGLFFEAPTSKELPAIYNKLRGKISGMYKISMNEKAARRKGALIDLHVSYGGRRSYIRATAKGCSTPIIPIINLILD